MAGESKVTTDHEEIRKWVEERDGYPAAVKSTSGKEDAGLLRIDYEGFSGSDSLQRISWEEFFEKFEEKKLAFLYQEEKSSGEESRFSKFISREK
jgi:hypothetical protein